MDPFTEEARAQNADAAGYGTLAKPAPPPRTQREEKNTPLDRMRYEAERAINRVANIRQRLELLGERLVGPVPQNASKQAGEAIQQAGFIPGTSQAIEIVHIELTALEELLTGFEQTI